MYAIVEIAGHQYKVEKDQQIFVNRLAEDEGANVKFDEVLLIDNGGKVTVGAPAIKGAQVTAKVERHLKGDKVIIFKKKRRKGYKKKNGFRASLTEIKIEGIVATGAKAAEKKAEPKAEKVAAPKKEAAPKAEKPVADTKGDKLSVIEGIGPKTEEILNAAGINTYADLAGTSVEKLKEILEAAGGRYKSIDPSGWPAAAKEA